MVKEETLIENNFNDNVKTHNRTNHKSHIFVREDILREFEEYKNEQNSRMKNSNFSGKMKNTGSASNERSFLNKTGANADSKSLDGFSIKMNNNNNVNQINKDVLLHDLLESKLK